MNEPPDFRSEKMDSPEGRGIALGRWSSFWYSIPDDVLADAYEGNRKRSIVEYDEDVQDEIAEAVLDDSELIGFWVAWHQAGGFAHLESGRLAPGDDLPQDPKVPNSRRGTPRRAHVSVDKARPQAQME